MTTPALSRATVDRAAERRKDPEWLAAAWSTGRLLVVDEERRAVAGDDGLVLLDTEEADVAERFFLGVADDGTSFWAGVGALPRRLDARPVTIRDVGATLPDRDAGLFVTAVALANWHATHRRCPRCGEPTEVSAGGWVRRCTADASEHFPRTDPAVIMIVSDGARCLLGRGPQWPERRFSTLAGFVEPGETLEDAVRREVFEEAGVRVGECDYHSSQPWPFPASIMLGFTAQAEDATITLGSELAEARWFGADELVDGIRSGSLGISSPLSVSYKLIEHWLRESAAIELADVVASSARTKG